MRRRRRGRPTRAQAEAAGQLRMTFDEGIDVIVLADHAVRRSRRARRTDPAPEVGRVLSFVAHRQRIIAEAQRDIHAELERFREETGLAA